MLKEIRDRVNAIVATIPDIKTVAPRIPANIQKHELPVIWCRHSGTTLGTRNDVIQQYLIRWDLIVIVQVVNTGLRAETENLCYDIADAIYDKFQGLPRLELSGSALASVRSAVLRSDSGLQAPIAFADGQNVNEYYGYRFVLEVDYAKNCS